MKVIYIKETFTRKSDGKVFYVVKYALVDENQNVVSKSMPLFWLTKEDFDKFVC